MTVDKLKMHSPDLTQRNIDAIAELLPAVITETLDADGNPVRAVDFDALRQELSDHIVEGPQERYQLDWPGKRAAAFAANAPIAKTLRPVRDESVDFDTTQNLFIEGDNLEALKLLQESYLGKVKLIYIDPPYNTGNDFVYEDDFAESSADYLARSGQRSETGDRLVANTEANGRFHSDWLSMMYPRLKLARNLLTSDGYVFVSIDDHEVSNLRAVMAEIFGADTFVGTMVWQSKKGGGSDNAGFVTDHEYVAVFSRNSGFVNLGRIEFESAPLDREDDKGPYRRGRELNKWGSNSLKSDRPTMYFPIPGPNGEDIFPIRSDGEEGCWRRGKKEMLQLAEAGEIEFAIRSDGRIGAFEKVRSTGPSTKPYRTWLSGVGTTADGTKALKSLFGAISPFPYPKPLSLLDVVMSAGLGADEKGIVLDFFGGSGSTAEAVMRANARDGGQRSFIVVQVGEPVESGTAAAKLGFETIADLARERIKRVGAQIDNQAGVFSNQTDVGFRVLRVDSSNMVDSLTAPEDLVQAAISTAVNTVKIDRGMEDLLFQVLVDWGLDLASPISVEEVAGRTVLVVADGALIACFADEVNDEVVRTMAARNPLRAVFRDSGFTGDAARINAEQIFREVSPETEVKAI